MKLAFRSQDTAGAHSAILPREKRYGRIHLIRVDCNGKNTGTPTKSAKGKLDGSLTRNCVYPSQALSFSSFNTSLWHSIQQHSCRS